ncbi:DUF11 domain-containing protein [Agreia pratensis]|uniref:beta strand repeat-containing protein n=1 Tax=Agreia pratensis TaxID=150121 RepID=UPI00188AAEE6|nr:DUF11 domain-containing protein [Agreia pratensis]MBF4636300.1 DUF11 domain-containing protein [Agreia pratensis]
MTNTFAPAPAYTVAKTASAAKVNPGDTVTYTVTVTNTGNSAYTAESPAAFTDDLSAVLDDATYNGDASGGATVNGTSLSWSGPLAFGETKTITYSVTVNNPDNGNKILTNAVTPTSTGGTCATPGGCVTNTPVQSVVFTKTADRTEVVPGDTITYTITVQNTGQADYTTADPASFTDDLSAVLDDATYNNDATSGATYAAPTLSWSGPVAVGETVTVTYSVTVNNPVSGDSKLTNAVESPTGGSNCEPGSNDPACIAEVPGRSYTVAKSSSTVEANPGDTVTYSVTVTNTGQSPYTSADPASFSDDLSAVLDDAAYNDDASDGATVTANTLSWSGPLAVGASKTITYSVKINDPDTGDKTLTNTVRPTSTGGSCVTPGGCRTDTPVRSYTVAKTSSPAGAVTAGSVITYTVTVTNTGRADYTSATPASFADDLSSVTDDATYNNDADNGATYAAPTLSWSGSLAVGETKTVTYTVTVGSAGSGDGTLTNAVITDGPGGGCATPGGCITTNLLRSYTTAKSADKSRVSEGDTITYTVTVTNTGQADYTAETPASFTDDLSAVTDDATYNGDATNGATVAGNTLSWSGPLAVGATTTITYSFTVNTPDTGDKTLSNAVVPDGSSGGICPTPGGCITTGKVASFTTAKTSSASTVKQGETVTYTVTVTNTGQADYTAETPASFTDDLSAVTDDATYNGDATNGATVAGNTLSWSGPLAVGATTTITYSFTVNTPDTGDKTLSNAVVPDGSSGGICPTPGGCITTTEVQAFTVEKTVDAVKVIPGDKVTYTVTVTNTGKVAYTTTDPAAFTDDLSAVTDDATYNGDATNGATVSGNTLSWSGALAVGETTTITYSFTVNSPDTGDKKLTNTVVPNDPTACLPGKCITNTPVGSFVVAKVVDKTEVAPGGVVNYTITVTNTGQVPYTAASPASFTDDLSKVTDDATYNGDASNGATVSGNTLSWAGALETGATTTVTYSFTVNNPDTGDKKITNAVDPGEGGGCLTEGGCITNTTVTSTPPQGPTVATGGTAAEQAPLWVMFGGAGTALAALLTLLVMAIAARRRHNGDSV